MKYSITESESMYLLVISDHGDIVEATSVRKDSITYEDLEQVGKEITEMYLAEAN